MHKHGITLYLNRRDSCEILRDFKHHNHVFRFRHASRWQPLICRLPKQGPARHRLTSREGKRSGTELEPSAEFATVPRHVNATVGLFPVADPGKVILVEEVQNQESQVWIANSDESSSEGRVQQMRRVMTITTFFAGAEIQNSAALFRSIWPAKFGIRLDRHLRAEGSGARLAARRGHIEKRNFICAGTLLRAQLDTALRANALSLVNNPEQFASDVLGGSPVNKMKDSKGKKMTDAYLAERLSETHPWVQKTYSQLAELGHFSRRHIFASVAKTNGEERTVHFQISAQDPLRPDEDYFEIVECFYETMRTTCMIAAGYHAALRAMHARNASKA